MDDIRDILFRGIKDRRFRAVLTAERAGVLSGVDDAMEAAAKLGIELEICRHEGQDVGHGERIGNIIAPPRLMAMAEESVIGTMAKASGIATAARTAVQLADGRIRIVSGSWKKMPPAIKGMVRRAVSSGGADFRITKPPMLYIDKNFIRMLGGIPSALAACSEFPKEHVRVIQLRSEDGDIAEETVQAVKGGAGILMVDTGSTDDLLVCLDTLSGMGARKGVEVAYSGNVKLTDIPELAGLGADILCIGRQIVDAPLMDIRLDVIGEE